MPDATRLLPPGPPGRGTRKARAFSEEIARLHALDYTLDAIRVALAAVGVLVSRSTVYREVARLNKRRPTLPPTVIGYGSRGASMHKSPSGAPELANPGDERMPPAQLASHGDVGRRASRDVPISKEDAEAFFEAHPSNPLFQTKETS